MKLIGKNFLQGYRNQWIGDFLKELHLTEGCVIEVPVSVACLRANTTWDSVYFDFFRAIVVWFIVLQSPDFSTLNWSRFSGGGHSSLTFSHQFYLSPKRDLYVMKRDENELTIAQAATILNMLQAYISKLLEGGDIYLIINLEQIAALNYKIWSDTNR